MQSDYKSLNIKPEIHKKINKYIAVSKIVQKSFKELTGIEAELIYNPIQIEKPKKILNLISATRLTNDKGKDRMIKLAELLNCKEIPYRWTIFTDNAKKIDNPNMIYMKPRLSPKKIIGKKY